MTIARRRAGGDDVPPASSTRQRTLGSLWDSSSAPKLGELFNSHSDLVFNGSMDEACLEAVNSGTRWLIVNIQSEMEFDCHALNRDIWRNSAVQQLLELHFIFWQQNIGSDAGRTFAQFYSVEAFPFVCIMQPVTKAIVRIWTGKIRPKFIDELNEFLESNELITLPGRGSSSNMSSSSSSSSASSSALSVPQRGSKRSLEDDVIASAIAASLESSSNDTESNTSSSSSSASSSASLSCSPAAKKAKSDAPRTPSSERVVVVLDSDSDSEREKTAARAKRASSSSSSSSSKQPAFKSNGASAICIDSLSDRDQQQVAANAENSNADAVTDAEPTPEVANAVLQPEPEMGNPLATRVQFQIGGGRVVQRRFMRACAVEQLYVFVRSQLSEAELQQIAAGAVFVLVTSFPKTTIASSQESLETARVLNTRLVLEWQ